MDGNRAAVKCIDFTDIRTALRFFFVSVFFLVPVIVIFSLFSVSISGLLPLP